MNQNIHRINDIIRQVPDLKYDASTGQFETDRRALYDFAELIVRECATVVQETRWMVQPSQEQIANRIKQHFGVE